MTLAEVKIPDQRALWNRQHACRGATIEGAAGLKNTPNTTAINFAKHLGKEASIFEVGCANGRDARYWARLGHFVAALDFSYVALAQLNFLARQQAVNEQIATILWDISQGTLPLTQLPTLIDAFYARSALHINDDAMANLGYELNAVLKPGGVICIEGKGPMDTKIVRSEVVEQNLVIDHEEGGHLRRIWTTEFAKDLCSQFGWRILALEENIELWNGTAANFMRLTARTKNKTFR